MTLRVSGGKPIRSGAEQLIAGGVRYVMISGNFDECPGKANRDRSVGAHVIEFRR